MKVTRVCSVTQAPILDCQSICSGCSPGSHRSSTWSTLPTASVVWHSTVLPTGKEAEVIVSHPGPSQCLKKAVRRNIQPPNRRSPYTGVLA